MHCAKLHCGPPAEHGSRKRRPERVGLGRCSGRSLVEIGRAATTTTAASRVAWRLQATGVLIGPGPFVVGGITGRIAAAVPAMTTTATAAAAVGTDVGVRQLSSTRGLVGLEGAERACLHPPS